MKRLTTFIALLLCISLANASAIGKENTSDATPPVPKKSVTVIIDAGHGGQDPGNLNGTSGLQMEKHLNLAIAKKFGGYLEEFLPGKVDVIYTRQSDVYIALENRVSVGNSKKADYFISIHCNSSPNKPLKSILKPT